MVAMVTGFTAVTELNLLILNSTSAIDSGLALITEKKNREYPIKLKEICVYHRNNMFSQRQTPNPERKLNSS